MVLALVGALLSAAHLEAYCNCQLPDYCTLVGLFTVFVNIFYIALWSTVQRAIALDGIGLSTVYCDNLERRGAMRVNVMNKRQLADTVEDYTCLCIIPARSVYSLLFNSTLCNTGMAVHIFWKLNYYIIIHIYTYMYDFNKLHDICYHVRT